MCSEITQNIYCEEKCFQCFLSHNSDTLFFSCDIMSITLCSRNKTEFPWKVNVDFYMFQVLTNRFMIAVQRKNKLGPIYFVSNYPVSC